MNRFGVQCNLDSPRVRSNFEAVQQAQQLELRADSDSSSFSAASFAWDDAQDPLADSEISTAVGQQGADEPEVQAETQEERLLDAAQAIAQQAHGRMVEASQEIARQAQERLLQAAREIGQQTQARLVEAAQVIAQQPHEGADEEAQARLLEAAQEIARQAQEQLVFAARAAMPPLRLPSAMTVNRAE